MSNMASNKDDWPVEDHLQEGLQENLREGSARMSPFRHFDPSTIANTAEVAAKAEFPLEERKPRGQWFLESTPHEYILPAGGPMNATMVEIITLLPLWFRNRDIAVRFQNNEITTPIHFEIFETHRDIGTPTAWDKNRAREFISSTYRNTMRRVDSGWKKAKQEAPKGWDATSVQINHFLPDDARKPNYNPPPAVPFKWLARGVKKMPTGNDAADLTRALLFTLENQFLAEDGRPIDHLFPNDLQNILDHIGRTVVTPEHSDRAVIARYYPSKTVIAREGATKKITQQFQTGLQHPTMSTLYPQQFPPVPPSVGLQPIFAGPRGALHGGATGALNFPLLNHVDPAHPQNNMGVPSNELFHPESGSMPMFGHSQHEASRAAFQPFQPPNPTNEATVAVEKMISDRAGDLGVLREQHGFTNFPEIPDCCRIPELEVDPSAPQGPLQNEQTVEATFTVDDFGALMAANQNIDFSDLLDMSNWDHDIDMQSTNADVGSGIDSSFSQGYPEFHLLKDCAEANNEMDQSALARAARWAREPANENIIWMVSDVDFIVNFLDNTSANTDFGGGGWFKEG